MSLTPKTPGPPAPSAAPASAGADSLILGSQENQDLLLGGRGVLGLGRLKLRAPVAGTANTSTAASTVGATGGDPSQTLQVGTPPGKAAQMAAGMGGGLNLRLGQDRR